MILSLSILSILSPCIFIYTEKDPLIINSPYISLITSLHHIISLLEPGRFCWIIHKYPIKSWISYKITIFLLEKIAVLAGPSRLGVAVPLRGRGGRFMARSLRSWVESWGSPLVNSQKKRKNQLLSGNLT